MSSKFTSALAQGGLPGKSKVRTRAPNRDVEGRALRQLQDEVQLLRVSVAFGTSWSRTRQALEQACDRGELFSLKIGNKRWYPASFMDLAVEDVKAVCLLLRRVDPVSQFIFWERKHGALAGQTLPEALQAGKTAAVLRAAEVFAGEHAEHAAIA